MNKEKELANEIIDDISELIEEHYPEIKPKCITGDEIENPALINGTIYYDLECKIADKIKAINKKAVDLVAKLMEVLETQCPEYYFKSDFIAECNDFLKIADGEGEE